MELIIVSTIVIVSVLNILGIKLVTSMNMLIIVMQLIFIALFLYLSFSSAFTPDKEALLALLTVMSDQVSDCLPVRRFCVSAFLGFDAISTMAEETKDAKRALPKTILYTVFIAGTLFIIISYAAHLGYPAWRDFLPNTDIASIQVMEKSAAH